LSNTEFVLEQPGLSYQDEVGYKYKAHPHKLAQDFGNQLAITN